MQNAKNMERKWTILFKAIQLASRADPDAGAAAPRAEVSPSSTGRSCLFASIFASSHNCLYSKKLCKCCSRAKREQGQKQKVSPEEEQPRKNRTRRIIDFSELFDVGIELSKGRTQIEPEGSRFRCCSPGTGRRGRDSVDDDFHCLTVGHPLQQSSSHLSCRTAQRWNKLIEILHPDKDKQTKKKQQENVRNERRGSKNQAKKKTTQDHRQKKRKRWKAKQEYPTRIFSCAIWWHQDQLQSRLCSCPRQQHGCARGSTAGSRAPQGSRSAPCWTTHTSPHLFQGKQEWIEGRTQRENVEELKQQGTRKERKWEAEVKGDKCGWQEWRCTQAESETSSCRGRKKRKERWWWTGSAKTRS